MRLFVDYLHTIWNVRCMLGIYRRDWCRTGFVCVEFCSHTHILRHRDYARRIPIWICVQPFSHHSLCAGTMTSTCPIVRCALHLATFSAQMMRASRHTPRHTLNIIYCPLLLSVILHTPIAIRTCVLVSLATHSFRWYNYIEFIEVVYAHSRQEKECCSDAAFWSVRTESLRNAHSNYTRWRA